MADRRLQERLQPSLLDRLTDDAPGDLKEKRDDRVIDARRLRDILQRDLSWLLNTSNLQSEIDPELFPQASVSVVNYGIEEVAGTYSTERRAVLLQDAIEQAIQVYEPRIRRGTLSVLLHSEENARETLVTFDIRADMWAQPLPQSVYLRSEVDLTTGAVTLESTG
ncbi:hypothetical protein RGUI_3035 [Rhodovulum sp. P5]|uniref:type VI secretion system baseplate subunit TssE n=1 Tax=Rhodovulum sp. P5 TaxID=1564506 RepID=UPI0009C3C0B8|nr:type VI secretion system baseplate subunit TssE [Rhodovulum sp. P5]ARE41176.1 hypothetical protein RGUI_3035 [Rhodovulum sp. P5]